MFPIVTLAILDVYPRQGGSVSSLQAFSSMATNAVVAGALSPLLSHRGIHLALGVAAFSLVAWLFWLRETRASDRQVRCADEPAVLEPLDEM